MKKVYIASIPFLLFLAAAHTCFSQQPLTLHDDTGLIPLGRSMAMFMDEGSALTVEQVSSPAYRDRFTVSDKEVPHLGTTRATLWLRFSVDNRSTQRWMLEIDNPILDTVTVYLPHDGDFRARTTGAMFRYADRDHASPNFLFSVDPPRDTVSTYYVRMNGRVLSAPMTFGTREAIIEHSHRDDWFFWLYFGLVLMILAYNMLLYVFIREVDYLYYSGWVLSITFYTISSKGYLVAILPESLHGVNFYAIAGTAIATICALAFGRSFLRTKRMLPVQDRLMLLGMLPFVVVIVLNLFGETFIGTEIVRYAAFLLVLLMIYTTGKAYRRGYTPARYYMLAFGSTFLSVLVYLGLVQGWLPYTFVTSNALVLGTSAEMVLFSIALGDKLFTMRREKEVAQLRTLEAAQENERLVREQNIVLENTVEERTRELRQTLVHLQRTQEQLVHNQKLASLGQLTSGIAHEMQNPLNFVNNFSELSIGIIDDVLAAGSETERVSLLSTLRENMQKISQHGKRAAGIIRSMIHHAQRGQTERAATNINRLLDEHITYVYHSMREKFSGFDVPIEREWDASLPEIEVRQQEIGRVVTNILANALDAVAGRRKTNDGFLPVVHLRTRRVDGGVEIRIGDNGPGIPDEVRGRLFQPFVTTKPPGEGTGLGLSLSYDIVKAHGGDLRVESSDGSGTVLSITLPA